LAGQPERREARPTRPHSQALRLVASPAAKAGRFSARLESGEVIVASTRQPLVDGARALLALGFDPATPLTMRHHGKAFDSFRPLPIGQWAGWTFEENDRDGLRCVRWRPRALHAEGQKSGSEASLVPEGQVTGNRFHGVPALLIEIDRGDGCRP
jgi:hypothetical protein